MHYCPTELSGNSSQNFLNVPPKTVQISGATSTVSFRLMDWAPRSNFSARHCQSGWIIITSWGSRWCPCSTAGRGGTATARSRRPPLAAARAPPPTVAAAAVDPAVAVVVDVVEMVADAGEGRKGNLNTNLGLLSYFSNNIIYLSSKLQQDKLNKWSDVCLAHGDGHKYLWCTQWWFSERVQQKTKLHDIRRQRLIQKNCIIFLYK